jgi:hypothetical protein
MRFGLLEEAAAVEGEIGAAWKSAKSSSTALQPVSFGIIQKVNNSYLQH